MCMRTFRLKTHVIPFIFLAYACLTAYSGGVTNDNYANAPGDSGYCSNCHFDGGGGGSISLVGLPSTITPGATYPLTLFISDNDALVGGFQIVATNGSTGDQLGTFTTASGTQPTFSDRLTHLGTRSFSGGAVSWSFDWTAPTTGLPSSFKFYFAGNAANANGQNGTGDDGYAGTSASIPLPIELTRFDGRLNKGKVELSWETAMEKNADRFSITRSTDNRNFEQIGEVSASGDSYSKQEYQFIDERLPNASQIYYRLEEHDFDGATTQSKIITIQHNRSGVNVRFLDGNPVKLKGSVRFVLETNQNLQTARLVGIDGRILGQAHVEKEAEVEIFANLSGLNFAFLQLFDADQRLVHTERIIR